MAAAERDREMIEIAANTFAIAVNIKGRLRRIREMVTKGDVLVHPVADCLHPRPARRSLPE